MKQLQSGYIALMSAIVISALLLAITVSLGLGGFFSQTNILDAESKEQSFALAQGCVSVAILDIAKNTIPVSFPATVNIDQNMCTIISINQNSPATGQTTIKSAAAVSKSHTNIKAVINSTTFSIISFSQCTVSPCP